MCPPRVARSRTAKTPGYRYKLREPPALSLRVGERCSYKSCCSGLKTCFLRPLRMYLLRIDEHPSLCLGPLHCLLCYRPPLPVPTAQHDTPPGMMFKAQVPTAVRRLPAPKRTAYEICHRELSAKVSCGLGTMVVAEHPSFENWSRGDVYSCVVYGKLTTTQVAIQRTYRVCGGGHPGSTPTNIHGVGDVVSCTMSGPCNGLVVLATLPRSGPWQGAHSYLAARVWASITRVCDPAIRCGNRDQYLVRCQPQARAQTQDLRSRQGKLSTVPRSVLGVIAGVRMMENAIGTTITFVHQSRFLYTDVKGDLFIL